MLESLMAIHNANFRTKKSEKVMEMSICCGFDPHIAGVVLLHHIGLFLPQYVIGEGWTSYCYSIYSCKNAACMVPPST